MAIIRTVRLAVGKTVNLGNFNSIRVEVDVSADLAEGEALPDVTAALQSQLRELWETTYRSQKKGEVPQ